MKYFLKLSINTIRAGKEKKRGTKNLWSKQNTGRCSLKLNRIDNYIKHK